MQQLDSETHTNEASAPNSMKRQQRKHTKGVTQNDQEVQQHDKSHNTKKVNRCLGGLSHNPPIHGENVRLCRQKENKGTKLSRQDPATLLSGARNYVSVGQLSKVVRLLAAIPAWFCPDVTAVVDWA